MVKLKEESFILNKDFGMTPIKCLKSSYSQNQVFFVEQSSRYTIINDENKGIIVLDDAWNEVKRIYIGDDILLPEIIYVDFSRNRLVLVLEETYCFIDIDNEFVKLIPTPQEFKTVRFKALYHFTDDVVYMNTSKGILFWSLKDFTVQLVADVRNTDKLFNWFYTQSKDKHSYFHNGVLAYFDSNKITIIDSMKKIEINDFVDIDCFDIATTTRYCLAVAEDKLQLIKLDNDDKSKLISFKYPLYGACTVFFEQDDELHLILLRWNDLEATSILEEYVIDFDKLPDHVVI